MSSRRTVEMRSPLAPVKLIPEEAAQVYREKGYWIGETFSAFIADRCTRFATNAALVAEDARGESRRFTYQQLLAQADALAAKLTDYGIAPGDRAIVALPNKAEYLVIVLALFRQGALPVFALPTHRETELGQFAQLSDAAALFVDSEGGRTDWGYVLEAMRPNLTVDPPALIDTCKTQILDLPAPKDEDVPLPKPSTHIEPDYRKAAEVAFLQLSGGTTGISKLIPRTADAYLYSCRESATICEVDESTVFMVSLPAAHNFAMSSPGILGVMDRGGSIVMAKDPSPATAFRLIEKERVTLASLVPPLMQAWIASARRRHPDTSSLKLIGVGGSKLADTIAEQVTPVLGAKLQQVFGMAEGLVCYTRLNDPAELINTTQGIPICDDDEILLVDEDDNPVPEGESGELLTRGPYTIRCYYNNPVANRDSFTPDGYYRTGDLVKCLPSGYLVVTGRVKDQINRAGEKIATDEIENLALAHPDVFDAISVGVPDDYLGEKHVLVILPNPGVKSEKKALADDIAQYLIKEGLATFKRPDQIVIVKSFPSTNVGKNSRKELRNLLVKHIQDNHA